MSEKLKAMDRLNYIRGIHGLPAVTYNTAYDRQVQKSALISVANKMLTHFPDSTFKCYSPGGDSASQRSNLHLSWSSKFLTPWNSAMSIDGWINERNSPSIGHRRWFLSPFLKSVSFGRVDQIIGNGEYLVGTTMYVWDYTGATTTDVEYVACPYHEYPATAFQTDLIYSFTALYSKSSQFSNSNVNYNNTSIQILDESNKSYPVHSIAKDNDGYGVPNNIQWRADGLVNNTKYIVKINNVKVNGTDKNFEYWFKLK
jgi:hypothetical protein